MLSPTSTSQNLSEFLCLLSQKRQAQGTQLALAWLSTSSLTQPQGFPLLRIREEPALANQQTPSITSSFLLPAAYKPLALHSSSELLSICSIGYYPIHELLDKVNKICIIFLVEFCSLIV